MKNLSSDDTLLARWLDGSLSEAELAALSESEDLEALKKLADAATRLAPPAFDSEASWDAFTKAVPQKQPIAPQKRPLKRNWMYLAGAVAASVALIMTIFTLIPPKPTLMVAYNGNQSNFSLPDQSEVTLNAGSRIQYLEKGWNEDRVLELTGEAFFKVKKGSDFVVHTPSGVVKVLGTSFNVVSRNDRLEVVCFTGKVRVESATKGEQKLLTPGMGVRITANGVKEYQVEASEGPAWQQGIFKFNEIPFEEVIAEFERQLNVKVATPEMNGRLYTGAFYKEDLEKSLKLLAAPMGLQYEKISDKEIRLY